MGDIRVPVYPCDRGVPNDPLVRGWHHFEASPNGVVVCRYCGRKPGQEQADG